MTPLNPSQFNLHNETEAMDFLGQLLDDSILKYDAQAYSRYFWDGTVVLIVACAAYNVFWRSSLILR